MTKSIRFSRRSTVDQVIAGVDLSGKRILVTGCSSGLGLATMNSLAANGATVIGLARTLESSARACAGASRNCIPIACDLSNLDSIAAAVAFVRDLAIPLDAIIANAGVAKLPSLAVRYGVEMQFLVNHLGHFMLIDGLLERLRDKTGRIVIVSGAAGRSQAPAQGIMFDNLDGLRFYDPGTFYAQSKLANAIYAKELSRHLESRGIIVNSADPGAARTPLNKGFASRLFARSPSRAAATQTLLAASPLAAGITGEFWADCNICQGNEFVEDNALAKRLWDVSKEILQRERATSETSMQQAA